MATIFRKPRSPFWWTAYFDGEGRRRYASTKKRSRSEAVVEAAEMERRAKAIGPGASENSRRILRMVEDAADLARRSLLSAPAAQAIVGKILEASTGEAFRSATVDEWFRGWLSEKKGAKANGTYVRYAGVVEDFLLHLPASKRNGSLMGLSVADVRGFRDHLVAGGRSPVTANVAVKILRGPLNVARNQGLIPANPAEAVEMLASDSSSKGKAVFSPEDIKRLLRSPTTNGKASSSQVITPAGALAT